MLHLYVHFTVLSIILVKAPGNSLVSFPYGAEII